MSINDYIICCAQLALSQIAVSQSDMLISIPFTVKDYPKSLKHLNVGNDFASLPFRLKFPKDRDLGSMKQLLAD